jgi:hypothetical protein
MSVINVVVGRKRNINISANTTAGVIDSTTPVTLKNISSVGGITQRFDRLLDVSAEGETQGAVPVYDDTTDKYIVKKLDFTEIDGNLDGGTF